MWCPFGLAIPNPNPTWVSGSSSSGITVEETGTITLSAVPAALSMLYRVGTAAAEARRAAKASRCILALEVISPCTPTLFLSVSETRQPCGLLVAETKNGWNSLSDWIWGSKDNCVKLWTKLGGCAHHWLVSSGLVWRALACGSSSSLPAFWLHPRILTLVCKVHISDTELDFTFHVLNQNHKEWVDAQARQRLPPTCLQTTPTHRDLGTKLLQLKGFLVFRTVSDTGSRIASTEGGGVHPS